MKHHPTSGPRARIALLLGLAASTAGWAGPPMSVDAQAQAHWIHYTRLSANRQHADAPYVVADAQQLRWWLFDAKGRLSGQLAAWPLLHGERLAAGHPPSPLPPAARD